MFAVLIAATVAAAEPAPVQPAVAPAPAAEKKMDCCEEMKKGEGCDCCKDMDGKGKDAHADHGGHAH